MTWEIAINRTIRNNVPRVYNVLERHPYIKDLALELRKAKLDVINNLEKYVEETVESVKRIGGIPHVVSDSHEAREVVTKIIGERKRIIMGKSMVAYEIGLREHLKRLGKDVWETDLGEFLIQLANEPPSHIIAPAVHMSKERAEELVREALGGLSEDATHEQIVARVREFLRD
ncbi:MAG: LUD domain-containing protein, partial [Metallosphaera sp.]